MLILGSNIRSNFQNIVNKEAGIFNDKEYRKGNDSSIVDFDRKDLEGFNLFLDQLILSGPEIGVGGHFGVRTRHWTRFYDICHFCAIDYDVVAKVENVDIESSFIVKRAGEIMTVRSSQPSSEARFWVPEFESGSARPF